MMSRSKSQRTNCVCLEIEGWSQTDNAHLDFWVSIHGEPAVAKINKVPQWHCARELVLGQSVKIHQNTRTYQDHAKVNVKPIEKLASLSFTEKVDGEARCDHINVLGRQGEDHACSLRQDHESA
jgi:hypothetical protein